MPVVVRACDSDHLSTSHDDSMMLCLSNSHDDDGPLPQDVSMMIVRRRASPST